MAEANPSMQSLNLLTLPIEVRTVIYSYLFQDLSISIDRRHTVDTSMYPHQITATCRLLRCETIPLLHRNLTIICRNGSFSDAVRRRLPSHVLASTDRIVLTYPILYDEIKPNRRMFPNLRALEFLKFGGGDATGLKHLLFHYLKYRHDVQCLPREGLERDYLPENTLWDVVQMSRARRGFDVLLTSCPDDTGSYAAATGREVVLNLDEVEKTFQQSFDL